MHWLIELHLTAISRLEHAFSLLHLARSLVAAFDEGAAEHCSIKRQIASLCTLFSKRAEISSLNGLMFGQRLTSL